MRGSATTGLDWLVRVGAGESWHGTVARLLDDGLPGLENLALIPGSVGGAPIQNIGAYGLELAERLQDVEVFDPASGALESLDVAACCFGYRDSVFKQRAPAGRVVVGVTLALPKQWTPVAGYADVENELKARGVVRPAARDLFDAVVAIRRRKLPDPAQVGNAGSFFKNPVVPRAQRDELIDRVPVAGQLRHRGRSLQARGGLADRGLRPERCRSRPRGGLPPPGPRAGQPGGATGGEILALAGEVQDAVRARFGIELEPEPNVV